MTTIPATGIQPVIQHIQPLKESSDSSSVSFANVLEKMVENVKETEAIVEQDVFLLAAGQSDDLHTVMIDASKAELALSLLVQVRNKALDAYNEIMNTTM